MTNDRAFIRHEILNTITVVNFLVGSANLRENEKEEILRHMKLVSLLTAETEFLLGKKRKFSHERVDLNEIFDMIDCLFEEKIRRKRMRLSLAKTNLAVSGDRDVILHGIEQIILRLMEFSKKIDVTIDEKKQKLDISYDFGQKLNVTKESMMKLLKEHPDHSGLFFHVAVRLMELSGVKLVFKKGLIEVAFTK